MHRPGSFSLILQCILFQIKGFGKITSPKQKNNARSCWINVEMHVSWYHHVLPTLCAAKNNSTAPVATTAEGFWGHNIGHVITRTMPC